MRLPAFIIAAAVVLLAGCETTQSTPSFSRVYRGTQPDVFDAAQHVLYDMNYRKFEGDPTTGKLTASTVVDSIATTTRWNTADVQLHTRGDQQIEVSILFSYHSSDLQGPASAAAKRVPFGANDGSYSAFFELLATALGQPTPAKSTGK